ncbi:unnamed protein product [Closterium sp. NIES-53]
MKLHVTTLLVKEGLAVSCEDVSAAVACFPNLTHLHLSDNSIGDAFLAHLADSCPKLTRLHVGRTFALPCNEGDGFPVYHYRRRERNRISTEGLGLFIQKLPDLKQLSLFCLPRGTKLPDSIFQLRHLDCLVVNNTSLLESPGFENLTALTSAYITVPITRQHLSKLLHLPRLAHLSTFTPRSNHQPTCAASVPLPSCIKSLEFLTNCPYEDAMVFSSAWQFAGLEELLITGCRGLETLPDCIGEFMPCLRKLTVRECGDFTHLPETVTLLSLETLIISGCYEYNTLPSSFDHLPALKLLVLEHLPLMALPPSFSHLTTLEALFIIECKEFWQVPADALCLTALKVLCFSESNQGLALPENVGGLGSLEALRLHGCRLPASFTTLSSLTSLDLNKCWPAELPEALGELSSLQELKFVHLSISQLPGSLTRLAALHTLEVRNCNSLSEVPMGLDALVWLKRLELMGCRQLSEAPAGLPPSLETLCLGPFREGSSLVVDISKLSQLRVLKLKCVGVVCGHERPRGCWSWDSRGRFSSWSVEGVSQARLNQLEELEMRLEGMSQEFLLPSYVLPRLRSLLIDAPGIRSLPVNMAAALPGLRQLKLLSWAPEELPRVILELSKLTSLTIHAPQLTSLPEGVSCLSRLRKVELIRCTALQHLPESLTHMQQLVLLQDTSLPSLPAGLVQLRPLEDSLAAE